MPSKIALLLTLALTACVSDGRESPTSRVESSTAVAVTPHFALHSHPVLNLHHFLYQCARAEARQAGERLSGRPVDVVEQAALAALSGEQRTAWDDAVAYYRRELASRDLLFDGRMGEVKRALLRIDGAPGPEAWSAPLDAPFVDALQAALPVYLDHFWPGHDAENRAWIAAAAEGLVRHEAELVARMTDAYGGSWPPAPARVDVCAYANWAGAYTTGDPIHVTLSSLDSNSEGNGALEVLVHEASHCGEMVSALRQELQLAFSARGGEPPRDLWHLFIFFTAGESVRRTLVTAGVVDYAHYGARTGLYERGPWAQQYPVVALHWSAFLDGDIPRATALARIAAAIAP